MKDADRDRREKTKSWEGEGGRSLRGCGFGGQQLLQELMRVEQAVEPPQDPWDMAGNGVGHGAQGVRNAELRCQVRL